ncbi:MAG: hypothetical protein NT118_14630, partial [Lentisphaerae bacterium]|nr:hypothetical protein [Lentisphaerota bacterium]
IQLDDNTLGLVIPLILKLQPDKPDTYVAKISPSGELLFERELRLHPSSGKDPSNCWWYPVIGLIPAGNPLVFGSYALVLNCETGFIHHMKDDLTEEIKIKQLIMAFVLGLVLNAMVAMMMLRRREASLKRRLAWTAFAVLTGFSGLFVIWILCLTEKKVVCPNCGKKRWPTMDNCPFCKTLWPIPPQRDIDLITQI